MKTHLAVVALMIPTVAFASNSGVSHVQNAVIVVLIYCVFCGWIFWRHKKRIAQQAFNQHLINSEANLRDGNSILVAYASQTGNAEQLAQKTADALQQAGLMVELHSLSMVDATKLQSAHRALFIVSTTGEGDPPDNAHDFLKNVAQKSVSFPNLQYGILALGDSTYTQFCGFGHTLDTWLQHAHAMPIFDLVEVDRNNDGALRHWQYQLGILANDTEMVDWKTPDYQLWKLNSRTLANQGSVGAPVFHLNLSIQNDEMHWCAGDIAEVGPRNSQDSVNVFVNKLKLNAIAKVKAKSISFNAALQTKLLPHDDAGLQALIGLSAEDVLARLKTLPHREYSIASTPQENHLTLLVRQTHYADGRLGIGSGWLTEHAAVNSNIALRIRQNTAFHLPANNIPLILIGNGTGIAGLRAHLKARIERGHLLNWLIFGERNAEHDFYFKPELLKWHNQGLLAKLDTAFSRDQDKRFYVQDVVKALSADIIKWVNDGAAIYVCGSANGMAPAVHSELLEALGEATLSALVTSGRYRRDVY